MDPDETLELLRQSMSRIESSAQVPQNARPSVMLQAAGSVLQSATEAAEYFEALDGWLSNEGFLPSSWRSASSQPGRPKKQPEEPIELPEGVEHGTRAGYSAGCRCGGCRGANAAAAREWREKKKQQQKEES